MWGTETVATYVVKRAFEWKTLDLGYPSAIAVLWFVIIFGLSYGLTRRSSGARRWSSDVPARRAGCSCSRCWPTRLFSAGPYLWTATMSLRTTDEIHRSHYGLPDPRRTGTSTTPPGPSSATRRYFRNSAIVAVVSVLLVTVLGSMAGVRVRAAALRLPRCGSRCSC